MFLHYVSFIVVPQSCQTQYNNNNKKIRLHYVSVIVVGTQLLTT